MKYITYVQAVKRYVGPPGWPRWKLTFRSVDLTGRWSTWSAETKEDHPVGNQVLYLVEHERLPRDRKVVVTMDDDPFCGPRIIEISTNTREVDLTDFQERKRIEAEEARQRAWELAHPDLSV